MKRRRFPLSFLLLAGLAFQGEPAFAAEPAANVEQGGEAAPAGGESGAPLLPKPELRNTVLFYGTWQDVRLDSPFNPDNLLARLPERAWDAEYRGDARLRLGPCTGSAKLRVQHTRVTEIEPDLGQPDPRDGFVNTATLRCRLGSMITASAGRDVIQWGNGTLRSPSNPFFIDTGKISPIRELYGKDLASVTATLDEHWSLSVIRQYGIGRRDTARPFRPVEAFKVDWVGQSTTAGLILSQVRGGPRRVGGYLTWTASDAWLLYGEAALGRGSEGWFPNRVGPGPLDWRMEQSQHRSRRRIASLLGGAAYTFESGWTLTGELIYSNEGYSDAQREDAVVAAQAAAQGLRAGIDTAGAIADLAHGLDPNLRTLGRRYAFVQLLHPELGRRAEVALRATHNFDDRSSSLSAVVNYNLTPSIQLFAFGTRNLGDERSEFGRLFGHSLQAGMRLFF